MSAVIECRDISKVYTVRGKPVTALSELSFIVNAGAMCTLFCNNRLSRLAVMNILGGMEEPSGGTYLLEGVDLSTVHGDELSFLQNSRIGHLHTQPNLIGGISVLQNTALPLTFTDCSFNEAEDRAREVLRSLGLAGKEHLFPSALSEDEYAITALAREMCKSPAVMLINGSLDRVSDAVFSRIIDGLALCRDRGCAVVCATENKQCVQAINSALVVNCCA